MTNAEDMGKSAERPQLLMEPDELSRRLAQRTEPSAAASPNAATSTVVFDCRFSLADTGRGLAAYLERHMPGAWYLHLEQDLSGSVQEHGGRHPLPTADELAAKLRTAGVHPDSTVVVYDEDGSMAPRAWWLIHHWLGHPDVRVLNGGWKAWQRAGLPVDAELPRPQQGTFQPSIRPDAVLSVAQIEAIVDGRCPGTLVDARAPERYRGDVEPLDPQAGHIPGAVNKPFTDGLDAEGRWRPGEEQRPRFADVAQQAASAGSPLVMYCGSGVTACANLLALELAGYHSAKLYAGSWSDWCSYTHKPVAKGASPNQEA